jgi:hypothetical protein
MKRMSFVVAALVLMASVAQAQATQKTPPQAKGDYKAAPPARKAAANVAKMEARKEAKTEEKAATKVAAGSKAKKKGHAKKSKAYTKKPGEK